MKRSTAHAEGELRAVWARLPRLSNDELRASALDEVRWRLTTGNCFDGTTMALTEGWLSEDGIVTTAGEQAIDKHRMTKPADGR